MNACLQYKVKNKNLFTKKLSANAPLQQAHCRRPYPLPLKPNPTWLWVMWTCPRRSHGLRSVWTLWTVHIRTYTLRRCIVHNVHMTCAAKYAMQGVDNVDTLDAKFKSLYPFCLKNRQLFFSPISTHYPQYPQSISTLCSARFAAWVKLSNIHSPHNIQTIHKRQKPRYLVSPHSLVKYFCGC